MPGHHPAWSIRAVDVITVVEAAIAAMECPSTCAATTGLSLSRPAWAFCQSCPREIKTLYIRPGSPWENGHIERFHDQLRDECLNRELFGNLREARVILESWRVEYNECRPHSALGPRTPNEYTERKDEMRPSRTVFCKGCLQQLHLPIPIHGPLSVPFRIFGLRPSRMNPNLCNLCETMFKRIKKSSQIHVPLTILFADVRGYTSVSELLDTPEVIRLLAHFYEQCGEAVWERDGIVNKLIGDAVLAIFNFPIERDSHVKNAVLSAIALQERWASGGSIAGGDSQMPIGVGVGIHTGTVAVGEVGEACRDFTAVGSVVNLASRLQGAARPGEVLVTEPVYERVAEQFPNAPKRVCQLKGLEQPVNAWVLKSRV